MLHFPIFLFFVLLQIVSLITAVKFSYGLAENLEIEKIQFSMNEWFELKQIFYLFFIFLKAASS